MSGLAPHAPHPAANRGKVGPGIPGRWLRVVRTPEGAPHPIDREVTDVTEAAAVRAGWLLIDAHERLSTAGAAKVFGHELEAWHQYTTETIVPLKHPEGPGMIPSHETKGNLLRYRRTMDFARPGERVFDVGFGRGYLAAQLVREREVKSYHGIDVEMSYKPYAEALFAANGLAGAEIELEHGNLFELTREEVASTGATLVICCEVLEHVDDAELALRTLADALPDGTDLVFSVPLHGRLENVWGHLSVFDVARLKEMLDGAGLYAHHVEPLANTWSLVVASRSPGPSARVREATGRPPVRSSVALSEKRAFVDIVAEDMTPEGAAEAGTVRVERASRRRVRCRVAADGGVSFQVRGIEAMRLRIEFIDVSNVRRFVVRAHANGRLACTWVWTPTKEQAAGTARRFALRPGESSRAFVSGDHIDLDQADRVDVVAELVPGMTAEFGLMAAYLP
jgi:2-polyprenyl-3-methyl-5-hydroxy-6-metoxy-1,4-benzoquinol methylase